MTHLLEGLCWLVIEGAYAPDAVASALPWALTREPDGPRRLSLAQTLHDGTEDGPNGSLVAVFTHGGFSFVAKPGALTQAADASFERALSARFGAAWCLSSHFYAPAIVRYVGGAAVARVEEFRVEPAAGLLGLTQVLRGDGERVVMPGAFERLVGMAWAEVFPREGAAATFWRRAG